MNEKLIVTKRFIRLMLAFIVVMVGSVVYELVEIVLGYRTAFHNLGQICSTLGLMICVLAVNVKRKKEILAELDDAYNK